MVPKLEEGKVAHHVFHEGQGARLHQGVAERIWAEDVVRQDLTTSSAQILSAYTALLRVMIT